MKNFFFLEDDLDQGVMFTRASHQKEMQYYNFIDLIENDGTPKDIDKVQPSENFAKQIKLHDQSLQINLYQKRSLINSASPQFYLMKQRNFHHEYLDHFCLSDDRKLLVILRKTIRENPDQLSQNGYDSEFKFSFDFFRIDKAFLERGDKVVDENDPNFLFTLENEDASYELSDLSQIEIKMQFSYYCKYFVVIINHLCVFAFKINPNDPDAPKINKDEPIYAQQFNQKEFNIKSIFVKHESDDSFKIIAISLNQNHLIIRNIEFDQLQKMQQEARQKSFRQSSVYSRKSTVKTLLGEQNSDQIWFKTLTDNQLKNLKVQCSRDFTNLFVCAYDLNYRLHLTGDSLDWYEEQFMQYLDQKQVHQIVRIDQTTTSFMYSDQFSQSIKIYIEQSKSEGDTRVLPQELEIKTAFDPDSCHLEDIKFDINNSLVVAIQKDYEKIITYKYQIDQSQFALKEYQKIALSSNQIFSWPYLVTQYQGNHILVSSCFTPNKSVFVEQSKGQDDSDYNIIIDLAICQHHNLFYVVRQKNNHIFKKIDLRLLDHLFVKTQSLKLSTDEQTSFKKFFKSLSFDQKEEIKKSAKGISFELEDAQEAYLELMTKKNSTLPINHSTISTPSKASFKGNLFGASIMAQSLKSNIIQQVKNGTQDVISISDEDFQYRSIFNFDVIYPDSAKKENILFLVESNHTLFTFKKGEEAKEIGKVKQYCLLNGNHLFYQPLEHNNQQNPNIIFMMQFGFNQSSQKVFMEDQSTELLSFDLSEDKIQMLTRSKVTKKVNIQVYQFNFLSKQRTLVSQIEVKEQKMIDDYQQSNFYDGNNFMRKNIFYNITESSKQRVIHRYIDTIPLDKEEFLISECPLFDDEHRKLCFITKSKTDIQPTKITIMDYLKDKSYKIEKNESKFSKHVHIQQFTFDGGNRGNDYLCEHSPDESKLKIYNLKGQLMNEYDFKEYTKVYGSDFFCVSPDSTRFLANYGESTKRYDIVNLMKFGLKAANQDDIKVNLKCGETIDLTKIRLENKQSVAEYLNSIDSKQGGKSKYLIDFEMNNQDDIMIKVTETRGQHYEVLDKLILLVGEKTDSNQIKFRAVELIVPNQSEKLAGKNKVNIKGNRRQSQVNIGTEISEPLLKETNKSILDSTVEAEQSLILQNKLKMKGALMTQEMVVIWNDYQIYFSELGQIHKQNFQIKEFEVTKQCNFELYNPMINKNNQIRDLQDCQILSIEARGDHSFFAKKEQSLAKSQLSSSLKSGSSVDQINDKSKDNQEDQLFENEKSSTDIFIKVLITLEDCMFMRYSIQDQKEICSFCTQVDSQLIFGEDDQDYVLNEEGMHDLYLGLAMPQYNMTYSQYVSELERFQKFNGIRHQDQEQIFVNDNKVYRPYNYLASLFCDVNKDLTKGNAVLFDSLEFSTLIKNHTVFHIFSFNASYFQKILEFYNGYSKRIFQSMLLPDKNNQTALRKAINSNNQRVVNLILDCLSDSEQLSFRAIRKEAKHLINSENSFQFFKMMTKKAIQLHHVTLLPLHKDFIKMDDNKTQLFILNDTQLIDRSVLANLTSSKYSKRNHCKQCRNCFNHYFLFCWKEQRKNRKYKNLEKKLDSFEQYNVEIKVVDLSWIMGIDHGLQFLKNLSECQQIELLDLPMFQQITKFLYVDVQMDLIDWQFSIFLIFMGSFHWFSIYCWDTYDYYGKSFISLVQESISFNVTLFANIWILDTEMRQVYQYGRDYFTQFWNYIDLGVVVATSYFFYQIYSENYYDIESMQAIVLFFLYIKLFYFVRIFDSTYKIVKLITRTFQDSLIFLIIFFIGVLCQGLMFFKLDTVRDDTTTPATFTHTLTNTWQQSFVFSYRMSLGDWPDTSDMLDTESPNFTIFLFVFGTLVTMIVLLNMVIALMGDTFNNVMQDEKRFLAMDQLQLIVENHKFIYDDKDMQKIKYFITIDVRERNDEKNFQEEIADQIKEISEGMNLGLRNTQHAIDEVKDQMFAIKNDIRVDVSQIREELNQEVQQTRHQIQGQLDTILKELSKRGQKPEIIESALSLAGLKQKSQVQQQQEEKDEKDEKEEKEKNAGPIKITDVDEKQE